MSLQLALDGRPGRSARSRELLQPQGYSDELRSVLRVGDSTWGLVGLYRERGDSTSEIAMRLSMSQHTVRDHIKTVFEKLEVSSRTELVAKLFTEHYSAPAHADMVHSH